MTTESKFFDPTNPEHDLVIVQRGVVGRGAGYDTYILSQSTVAPDAKITISDIGANRISLMDGLEIVSALVAADAIKLILGNGAEVTVLGASNFDFEVSGNALLGLSGQVSSFTSFARDYLKAEVPTDRTVVAATGLVVGAEEEPEPAIVNVVDGQVATGQDVAERFLLDLSGKIGAYEIAGFDPEFDILEIIGLSGVTAETVGELNGKPGFGDLEIAVEPNEFEASVFVNFGTGADGELVSLSLGGAGIDALEAANVLIA